MTPFVAIRLLPSTLLVLAATWTVWTCPAFAEDSAVLEDFSGPEISWQATNDLGTNEQGIALKPVGKIAAQQVVVDKSRADSFVERIAISAPGRASMPLEIPIGKAPVLDELNIAVWLKGNRDGAQIAANVVLPRTIHPRTGRPRSVIIKGGIYSATNFWQRIELTDMPRRLKRRVRVMRIELESPIDPREAYVDKIMLFVPGGAGPTVYHTDDLSVDGLVLEAEPTADEQFAIPKSKVQQAAWNKSSDANVKRLPVRVSIAGARLLVDGRSFFPRAITHHGEPLEQLVKLGFNTVLLNSLPTPEQIAEAKKLELWFICPPPSASRLATKERPDAAEFSGILGWYLHDDEVSPLPTGQLMQWVEAIRAWDTEQDRPILLGRQMVQPRDTAMADIQVLGRFPLSQGMSSQQYASWLERQSSLLGPNAIYWLRVPLLPDWQTRTQAQHSFSSIEDLAVDDRRLEQLARLAATRGCGGWLVESDDLLTGDSPVVQRRRKALALINAQWKLIEPWIANGRKIGSVHTSDPSCTAIVMQVDRARLVIPLESAHGDRDGLTLVVPGIPETNQAYALTPAGFTPLAQKRIAGGLRVEFDRSSEALVVFTEDPRVIGSLRKQTRRIAMETAQLRKELAELRLKALMSTVGGAAPSISQVQAMLSHCQRLIAQGNPPAAYAVATKATRQCEQIDQSQQRTMTPGAVLTSYPFPLSLDTLGHIRTVQASFQSRSGGPNQLYGGDFEDLDQLTQWGWKNVHQETPGLTCVAELSALAPHHGDYCLQLSNMASGNPRATTGISLPLRIVSPEIQIEPGSLIEISGWARIDERLPDGAEGLMVEESLGGPDLALRIQSTKGWQPFRLIRQVDTQRHVEFSFALNGIGRASLDAIMVRQWQVPANGEARGERSEARIFRPPTSRL